ncbi:acyl-CoA thioesterase [Hymenobacter gummosus]|uniref:Acyl-CoA thioesterase n=1 Tax=Hymenobacter gummosus TaxID=1776032 RepID=A0A3S0H573_9BACT|nr:acyl-CoA thioesterase [Hymenobacter gummosus]RTQ49746.1 acyl-CoA thioesterase [Hymenobacter gummosus]
MADTALVRTPESRHRIYFQDCDQLGHLNNVRYLDYFLNAREDHVIRHYALNMGQLAREQRAAWVITKHHLSYLKPANHGEQVLIRTQLIHFDNSRLVVEMQMLDADGLRLKALLWSEMAFVDLTTGKRAEHSDALMDLLEQVDVDDVDYHPDGFDERSAELRRHFKQQRRAAGQVEE